MPKSSFKDILQARTLPPLCSKSQKTLDAESSYEIFVIYGCVEACTTIMLTWSYNIQKLQVATEAGETIKQYC